MSTAETPSVASPILTEEFVLRAHRGVGVLKLRRDFVRRKEEVLELFVKVRENWRNSEAALDDLDWRNRVS